MQMKNKIAFKLIMYFSATLVLFSIVIGIIFMVLFKNHTLNIYKSDLEKRTISIASTLSEFMNISVESSGRKGGMISGMQSGYGSYIRSLNTIAMADLWIVDEDLNLITIGYMSNKQYNYNDLPSDAETVVTEVFKGETTFSEGFSTLLNKPTLTVGTPIKSDGNIIGALLLHTPIEGMNSAINQGFEILGISIIFALILSTILSVILSISFSKPLKKMKNTAIDLSKGDYTVKTGIVQNDEIGELASTIDVLSYQLNIASQESEKLQSLRRDFVANISHELRTPVTVIRGSLEALCDEVVSDPEQVKEYHQQMLNESKFLERLVNDLLDLSRLQNVDFKIDMEEINLCDVVSDVIRSAKNIGKLKNINITFESDTEILWILGDYGRIRQLLMVLINNAIKFSHINGVVKIEIKGKNISIIDHGTGISHKDLPYIFDRFYKMQSESNKEGTGLGLAIAKQIADRHNISITVLSIENERTEFQLSF
jgi:signal transduction histidine kinase